MKFVQYISLIVGVGSLANGYIAGGYAASAGWILSLGAIWFIAEIRQSRWTAPLGFLLCVAAAGYGLWIDLSPGWMLAGAFGGMMVWSLSDFLHRVLKAAPKEDLAGLTQRYLIRLLIVTALGLAFSLFGLFFSQGFSFEWITFLVILIPLGMLYFIKKQTQG
jgi:hypothetical protein